MRSLVGRPAERAVSAACNAGSMTPATLDATLILELEHIFDRAVEPVGPQMRAGFGLDQLRGDADPAAALAHRAFEHIAHAQFAPDLLHIDGLALVGEARIAGDHEQPADAADSAVMISSTMPSTKYSCSGSPLMFWNGSTAIDGLSGSGRAVAAGADDTGAEAGRAR